MVRFTLLAVLIALPVAAGAQTGAQQAPGTIARFGVPAGFQFQYDPVADSIVMLEPGRRQLVLFIGPPADPAQSISLFLTELGAPQFARQIRPATIRGIRGAEVRIDAGGGSLDWVVALPVDGLMLGVWGKTVGEFADLAAALDAVLGSLAFAPATLPPLVSGTYQTRRDSSWDAVSGGIFVDEYVTLHPDGAAERSGSVGGTMPGGSILGQSGSGGIRWEGRGNRLLIAAGDEFYNFAVSAFNNGLELVDQQGSQLLWVRQ